jgi:hypothetical protein
MVYAISRLPKFSKSATIYKEAIKTLYLLANWPGPYGLIYGISSLTELF